MVDRLRRAVAALDGSLHRTFLTSEGERLQPVALVDSEDPSDAPGTPQPHSDGIPMKNVDTLLTRYKSTPRIIAVPQNCTGPARGELPNAEGNAGWSS